MTYTARFTPEAQDDLVRWYELILERDGGDWGLAERALEAIRPAIGSLQVPPFSYRKASAASAFLRELLIPFGSSGYIALFEIDDAEAVTVLAVRHRLADDYR